MKYFVPVLLLLFVLAQPVSALEITPPQVPKSGAQLMPEDTASFGESLWELLQNGLQAIRPDLVEASRLAMAVIAAVMMLSILHGLSDSVKGILELGGTVVIASVLLGSANSMIRLGADTVTELSAYGKLLLPVMTTALAAQGGLTASAALYTGTAVFNTVLTTLISGLLVPMVYLFLALAAGNSATGEELLKRLRDMVKNGISWCLKTILMVFTTYMGITGVISGTTDAVTLWNKMVLLRIYIILMTVEKTKTRGEQICQIR